MAVGGQPRRPSETKRDQAKSLKQTVKQKITVQTPTQIRTTMHMVCAYKGNARLKAERQRENSPVIKQNTKESKSLEEQSNHRKSFGSRQFERQTTKQG